MSKSNTASEYQYLPLTSWMSEVENTFTFLEQGGRSKALSEGVVNQTTSAKDGIRVWVELTSISELEKFTQLLFLESSYRRLPPNYQDMLRRDWAFLMPWFDRLEAAGDGNSEFWASLRNTPEFNEDISGPEMSEFEFGEESEKVNEHENDRYEREQ